MVPRIIFVFPWGLDDPTVSRLLDFIRPTSTRRRSYLKTEILNVYMHTEGSSPTIGKTKPRPCHPPENETMSWTHTVELHYNILSGPVTFSTLFPKQHYAQSHGAVYCSMLGTIHTVRTQRKAYFQVTALFSIAHTVHVQDFQNPATLSVCVIYGRTLITEDSL